MYLQNFWHIVFSGQVTVSIDLLSSGSDLKQFLELNVEDVIHSFSNY